MTFDYSVFRERLRRLFEGRGMTIKDFSEEIEISPVTMSRYLAGTRVPDLPYVVKIAEHFGISIDWLLGVNGDQFDVMPKDVQEIANLYSLANEDDRRVVHAVLAKYKG